MATMSVSSFYPPTYFPTSFFYLAVTTATSTTPTALTPYNAPSYFPSSYFYGNGISSTPTPTPIANVGDLPGRDQEAYTVLMTLIQGLGCFEEVILGSAIQRDQVGAGCYPLAVVTPRGWEESDDYDPTLIVRRVNFGITIVVQSRDGETRFEQLDRLASSILGVVDFVGLGSLSIPPLTRIRAGRFEFLSHYPEQSIELEGEFCTLIDPLNFVPVTN